MRALLVLAILAPLVGAAAAMPAKRAADAAHNRQVVATVEQAAKRYSRYPNGGEDANLYPELYTPRIPMADLDEAYR
jgi:hypothetical protein